MTTSGVGSNTGTSSTSSSQKSNPYDLKTEDFIKMMITQLQNQDPTEPVKNEELLAQMSQISQLQSSSTLTTTLQGLTLQNQIGSASSLIGKSVKGLDPNGDPVGGIVNSIKVVDNNVQLQLDSGQALGLGNVTDIAPVTATSKLN
jgi:flagellar basal-body rod modification protein FlgD